jgi:hypothetical protein
MNPDLLMQDDNEEDEEEDEQAEDEEEDEEEEPLQLLTRCVLAVADGGLMFPHSHI